MTCHAVGSKGRLSLTGWVRVEGWLLVKSQDWERGHGGKDVLVCGHLIHVKHM